MTGTSTLLNGSLSPPHPLVTEASAVRFPSLNYIEQSTRRRRASTRTPRTAVLVGARTFTFSRYALKFENRGVRVSAGHPDPVRSGHRRSERPPYARLGAA